MKFKKCAAALLSAVMVSANLTCIIPAVNVSAEGEAAAREMNKDCSVRVTVLDGLTGKIAEGYTVQLLTNPNASSLCIEEWNTSYEAVKTVSGLYAKDEFGIEVEPLSKSKDLYGESIFSFDNFGQTKDIVLKIFPWKPSYECSIPITIYDWTKCEDNFDTAISLQDEMQDDHVSISVYDENGNFFRSFGFTTGECDMSLPDGKYKLKANRSKNYTLVSPDSKKAKLAKERFKIEVPESNEAEFEVKNGKSDKSFEFFYERYAEPRPANDVTFHAVDSVTGEDIKDIEFSLTSEDTSTGFSWNTSVSPDISISDISCGRYKLEAHDVPLTYMQDFTFETKNNNSFSDIVYTAGAVRLFYEADEPSDVTLKFKPISEKTGDCSANISVVDMTTGKNIEGTKLSLYMNPSASSELIASWNTSDEAVKHVDKLRKGVNYGVYPVLPSNKYDVEMSRIFSFDNNWENKDIIIRAVPFGAKHNVDIRISDFTDLKLSETGHCFEGDKSFSGNAYVIIYDKNGDHFFSTAASGIDSMYLPDGEYTAVLSVMEKGYNVISRDWKLAQKVIELYPDMNIPYKEGVHFNVVDGKPSKTLNFFVTQKENENDEPAVNGSLTLSVVDGRTFKPVKDVKVKVITDNYYSNTIADLTSDKNGEMFVKSIPGGAYYIALDSDSLPNGYDINKSLSLFEKNFSITKENSKQSIRIVLCPKEYTPAVCLKVHDISGIEKDVTGLPIYREPNLGIMTAIMTYDDIRGKTIEIKGANDGKVYYSNIYSTIPLVLPDGDYVGTILYTDGDIMPAPLASEKLSILRSIKGYPEGVCGFTTKFSVVDGVPVGNTDMFVYDLGTYNSMHRGTCKLNVKVVDVTDEKKSPNAEVVVEYDPYRQIEIVDCWNTKNEPEKEIEGLFPSVEYRVMTRVLSTDYAPITKRTVKFSENNGYRELVIKAIPISKAIRGDANGDGDVDMSDVVMIMQSLANPNKYKLSDLGAYNADMDGDGVTVGDAQKIQRMLLGLDK